MDKGLVEGYKLSPQQERVWSLQQTEEGGPYRASCSILIKGSLDRGALKAALERIVRRHEILRTEFHFSEETGFPLQVVHDDPSLIIDEHDLTGLREDEQKSALAALGEDAGRALAAFRQGASLRAALVSVASDAHVMRIDLPALCGDQTTLKLLVSELNETYTASSSGAGTLTEVLQYADVAEWQNEIIEAEGGKIGKEHWHNRFDTTLLNLKLPAEARSPRSQNFEPLVLVKTLNSDLTSGIEAAVQEKETSPFAFLLTCWHILIQRLTGQADSLVGTACDGRRHEELKETLGPLTKYLPVYIQRKESDGFGELLRRIEESTDLASRWQEYFSWEDIIHSAVRNNAVPFMPFCFELQDELPSNDTPLTIIDRHAYIDRFKLKLCCVRSDRVSRIEFHFDSNLFRTEDVECLAEQFCLLLEGIINHQETPIEKLPLLTDRERQRLREWNEPGEEFRQDKCLPELFEEQVARTPDSMALIFGDERLSYRELNSRANQLGNYLREVGVGAEVRVGVLMLRSVETVVALLGVLKAGGVYVPLDPEYPVERLSFMAEDAGLSVLLTQERLRRQLSLEHTAQIVCLDAGSDEFATRDTDNLRSGVGADNLAYIIYTSGSTGQPKGVQITHRGVVNYITSAGSDLEIGPRDHVLQFASISFDTSAEEIYLSLTRGATLVLRTEEMMNSIPDFLRKCAEWEVTVLDLPTAYWHELTAQLFSGGMSLPGSIRLVIIGGEKALAERLALWQQKVDSRVRLVNTYGPTETTIVATVCDHLETIEQIGLNPTEIPIGRAVRNVKTHVVDKFGQLSPIGVAGELYIGGEGLARGYLNQPHLTAQSFVPDPFSTQPGARLYRTGDVVRWLSEGKLEFLGRLDQQIKMRGYRIELGEIEACLRAHAAIAEAVVVVNAEVATAKRLIGYVAARGEARLSTAELREHVRKTLPEYMVPVAFVKLETLPLTPSGKVDRKALPEPDAAFVSVEGYVAPRTAAEEALASIWGELLGLEKVGVFDNYFELGGDSILSIQVVARSNKVGLRLTANQIFEHQTIAGLVEVAETLAVSGSDQGSVADIEESRSSAGAFETIDMKGYTPSDFPLLKLDQRQLDRLLSEISKPTDPTSLDGS